MFGNKTDRVNHQTFQFPRQQEIRDNRISSLFDWSEMESRRYQDDFTFILRKTGIDRVLFPLSFVYHEAHKRKPSTKE